MTRPTPDSPYPYTRGDVARMTGASNPQVKVLGSAVLKKKAQGTGNHLGFNDDDALRIMVSRELLRVGVQVAALPSLFQSLDTPRMPSAKPWSWLRTDELKDCGATIVLLLGHPLAPKSSGLCYLTTAADAADLLKTLKQTFIVIDVGALINQLEQHTGKRYGA